MADELCSPADGCWSCVNRRILSRLREVTSYQACYVDLMSPDKPHRSSLDLTRSGYVQIPIYPPEREPFFTVER